MPDDAQKIWHSYCDRIKGRRLAEAALLCGEIGTALKSSSSEVIAAYPDQDLD